MNIDKMIDMLLYKLSRKHEVFYIEMRTYRKNQTSKTYKVKLDGYTETFKSKRNLLIYLSKQ